MYYNDSNIATDTELLSGLGKGFWESITGKKFKDTKVGGAAVKVVSVVNKVNPATILMRNGFLLALKVNFLNMAGRLKYGFLTDSEAQAKGFDMAQFKRLKEILNKAENTYKQLGGTSSAFRSAIKNGKANKKNPVNIPIAGLGQIDNTITITSEEYLILTGNRIDGLGEPITAATITSAMAVITPILGALASVKGLFKKKTAESAEFEQTKTDTEGLTTEEIKLVEEAKKEADPTFFEKYKTGIIVTSSLTVITIAGIVIYRATKNRK